MPVKLARCAATLYFSWMPSRLHDRCKNIKRTASPGGGRSLMAGTSRSRIDQQPKGPFNGFEDRAYHRARLAPTRSLSTLLVKDEEEYGGGEAGEGINQ